jgi:hypothetical protein
MPRPAERPGALGVARATARNTLSKLYKRIAVGNCSQAAAWVDDHARGIGATDEYSTRSSRYLAFASCHRPKKLPPSYVPPRVHATSGRTQPFSPRAALPTPE